MEIPEKNISNVSLLFVLIREFGKDVNPRRPCDNGCFLL